MPDDPSYTFPPLERRGLLLGLGAGQLAVMGAGVVTALVVRAVAGGGAGLAAALLVVALSLGAALWAPNGRPLVSWAPLALSSARRRLTGPSLSEAPTSGSVIRLGRAAPAGPRRARSRRPAHRRPPAAQGRPGRGTAPAGIAVVAHPGGPAEAPMAVVVDRPAGTVASVTEVWGPSFPLLDSDEQVRVLDGWRRVLVAVARPGTPVARLQWLHSSRPVGSVGGGRGSMADPAWLPSGDATVDAARRSYRQLTESNVPGMFEHRGWLVLAVGGGTSRAGDAVRSSKPRPAREWAADLRRETRLLHGQLIAAGLRPGPALDRAGLEGLIRAHYGGGDPGDGPAGTGLTPWPLAARPGWSALQADEWWHATFWISEWPTVPAGPDFLTPLLVGATRLSVSVIMAPVAADRALRQARSARTADLADAQIRSRAGFLDSARRERESAGATRREAELADGHAEFRFSGYVTVSAPTEEDLIASCAEAEHLARSARVEMRRLYGRQEEAFTWTLPLGRGLR